jgi:hypothetical protein
VVRFALSAGILPSLGCKEARRLRQVYIGPEHLLLGMLRPEVRLWASDNPGGRVLQAHGLDLDAARAEVDRLIAQGVLPGPRLGDTELLATLGIDLEAVYARLSSTFGDHAYYQAAERVNFRRRHAFPHTPKGGMPLACMRAMHFGADEAKTRDQEMDSGHLLLGLLRDAQDPAGTDQLRWERRLRAYAGLPDHGPHPVRLLIEGRGLTLQTIRDAMLSELDRPR